MKQNNLMNKLLLLNAVNKLTNKYEKSFFAKNGTKYKIEPAPVLELNDNEKYIRSKLVQQYSKPKLYNKKYNIVSEVFYAS